LSKICGKIDLIDYISEEVYLSNSRFSLTILDERWELSTRSFPIAHVCVSSRGVTVVTRRCYPRWNEVCSVQSDPDRSPQEFLVPSREPAQSFRGLRQRPKLATSFRSPRLASSFSLHVPHRIQKRSFAARRSPGRICTLLAVIPQPNLALLALLVGNPLAQTQITVQPPATNPDQATITQIRTLRMSPDIRTSGLSVEFADLAKPPN